MPKPLADFPQEHEKKIPDANRKRLIIAIATFKRFRLAC